MVSTALLNEHPSSLGLRLEIDLVAADLHSNPDRRTLVANYLAEYAAYQYTRREMAENLISTVLNELMEVLAFLVDGKRPVKITLTDEKEELHVWIEHEIDSMFDIAYPAFLASIEDQAPSTSYLSLLTAPPNFDPAFNQLGLTMIAHDFDCSLFFVPATHLSVSQTHIRIPTKDLLS